MKRPIDFNCHFPSVNNLHQCINSIPAPEKHFLVKIEPGGLKFACDVILQFGFGIALRDECVATLFLESAAIQFPIPTPAARAATDEAF